MYIYKSKLKNDIFLKNSDNPLAKMYIDEINSFCEENRGKEYPALKFSKFRLFDETGDRAIFQKDYFYKRRVLSMFLLKVWLYKKAEDIAELEDILFSVCDEYSWALPAHLCGILTDEKIPPYKVDLFSAETAHTIAEALSLCGDVLHPLVVRRCVDEIFKRVIIPFESEEREKYGLWWENGTNNWSAVCGGAVGMTALYLIEDEERLKKITSRTDFACNRFLRSCVDDGTCLEGITYWMYAMQYYVAFDELLKERTGETIIHDFKKVSKLAAFPATVCMKNGINVKFSDCGTALLNLGIFAKLNENFDVPVPGESYYYSIMDSCARSGGAVRTIAWFNPSLLHGETKKEDAFYPLGQWAILHRGDMSLALKGGHNLEPHNHNDIGSYMFVKGEDIIADELGAGKYTGAYFGKERYTIINNGSHGHSLPIVNGGMQKDGLEYRSDSFEKTENGAKISFAKAYGSEANLSSLVREFALDEKGLLVKDTFAFTENENTVKERIITKLPTELSGENRVSLLKDGKTLATVEFLSEGKVSLLKDSYISHKALEGTVEITVIEFESKTNTDNMEIAYIIK